jgi:RNA ligase
MQFNPVEIHNIKDVLPHIIDKPEIIRIDKEHYTVLDYVYSDKNTFDNPYAKECRGIKFDSLTGDLLARPYHKFHNENENEEYATHNINLDLVHHKLDKLDGSMCHSCPIKGEWRLMTRKGESEVAVSAMDYLKDRPVVQKRYHSLFESMPEYTFIFEYVAPTNRIVIHYKKEELILTGVRHTTSGQYISYERMATLAYSFGIPVVGLYTREDVDSDDEKEGTVVRFDSGAMYKRKSVIYVRKHRSKDLVTKFKDLVSLIVDNDLDDILPELDEGIKKRVMDYQTKLTNDMNRVAIEVGGWVEKRSDYDQKEFAGIVKTVSSKPKQALMFSIRKSGDPVEEVSRCLKKAYGDTTRLTDLFEELGLTKWEGDFFSENK